MQLGWYFAAVEAGTHKLSAVIPVGVVYVRVLYVSVPLDVGLVPMTSVSVERPRCVNNHVLDPTQTYTNDSH